VTGETFLLPQMYFFSGKVKIIIFIWLALCAFLVHGKTFFVPISLANMILYWFLPHLTEGFS